MFYFEQSAGIREPQVTEVTQKEERTVAYVTDLAADIDRTVKKYVDNLLHALEGVSARLSQLESRTHRMESSMDDLKIVIGNYSGATDGKLRQFENILREVSLILYVPFHAAAQACFLCCNHTEQLFPFYMNQSNPGKLE